MCSMAAHVTAFLHQAAALQHLEGFIQCARALRNKMTVAWRALPTFQTLLRRQRHAFVLHMPKSSSVTQLHITCTHNRVPGTCEVICASEALT